MRKLCFFVLALALVSVGIAVPACAGPHDDAVWVFQDGFDTYAAGEASVSAGVNWYLTPNAASPTEFTINNTAGAYSPANRLTITGVTSSNQHFRHPLESPWTPNANGKIYFHMRVKSPVHTLQSNTFYLYCNSDNGNAFGYWYGGELSLAPRVGGSVGTAVSLADGQWHKLDVVHDPVTNETWWYGDGTQVHYKDCDELTATVRPSDAVSMIDFTDFGNNAGRQLEIDDVKLGSNTAADYTPVIYYPEDTCSGLNGSYFTFSGTQIPEIDWEAPPHGGYQLRVFTSPQSNPGTGTPLYANADENIPYNWHQMTTTLAEGTTYWVYVRVKTLTGVWQPWSAGVDFRVQATANTAPIRPLLGSPTPANNGYYRGVGGALAPPTIGYTVPTPSAPAQSSAIQIGIDPVNPTSYADTPYVYSWVTDYTGQKDLSDPALQLPNMIEGQVYYVRLKVRNGCDTGGSTGWNTNGVSRFMATAAPVTNGVQPAGSVVLNTRRPTITWNVDTGSSTPITSGLIEIVDSPDATPSTFTYQRFFDLTGLSGDPGRFVVPEDLPTGKHLYAFVRLSNSAGIANQWSPNAENQQYPSSVDEGGFFLSVDPPNAPTIDSPAASESLTTGKPRITFSGDVHDKIQVKICTTNNSNDAGVWDSGQISSTTFSRACTSLLADGSYYAFVRIHNPINWSPWSLGRAFGVHRNDVVNVRHMDEAGLLATALTNSDIDMFGRTILESDVAPVTAPGLASCGTTNGVLRIADIGHGAATQAIRRHSVPGLDLDKGVTIVTAVAVDQDPLYPQRGNVPVWQEGQIIVCESNAIGRFITTFRVEANLLSNGGAPETFSVNGSAFGICTDNTSFSSVTTTDDPTRFNIVRITGRNLIAGVVASCEWKMYVNEQLVATATGCMPETVDPTEGWMVDSVSLGNGEGRRQGVWDYDFLAVNVNGDYAPGEWDYALGAPNPAGGTRDWNAPYAGIGDARKAKETAIVKLGGAAAPLADTVITKVVGSPQSAFFAQDQTGGIQLVTTDTKSGAVAAGKPITAIGGVIPFPANCTSFAVVPETGEPYRVYSDTHYDAKLLATSFTLGSGTLAVTPVAVSQKALGGGCIEQLAGSGLSNLGMLVRVFGTVVDTSMNQEPSPYGTRVIVIDDGSGAQDVAAQVDGSYTPVTGLTITLVSPEVDPDPAIGSVWMVEGIASYETVTGGVYPTARRILFPTLTQLH